MFGLTDVWIQGSSPESFWSDNLRGPLPDALADWMLPVAVACVVAVWVAYMVLRSRVAGDHTMRLASLAMLSTLLVFLVMNKVFSAQYLIWAIAPLMMVLLTSPEGSERRILWVLALAAVLTQADFAYNVGFLGGGANIDDLGMLVILAKNAAVVAATVLALRSMVSAGRETVSAGRPGPVANP